MTSSCSFVYSVEGEELVTLAQRLISRDIFGGDLEASISSSVSTDESICESKNPYNITLLFLN